jgi:signal transduction histidine kinase
MVLTPRLTLLAVALFSGVVTAAFSALPGLEFAYRSPSTHVALETVAGLIAVMAALLVFGRLQQTGRLPELLLLGALVLFATTNISFATVRVALASTETSSSAWALVAAHLVAVSLFAASAAVPDRPLRRPERSAVLVLYGCGLVLAALVALPLVVELPAPVTEVFAVTDTTHPILSGNLLFLIAQGASAVLYAVAAVCFTRRTAAGSRPFAASFAVAAALGVAARVNYLLVPSQYSDWVYTGDVFRVASYLALFAGAVHELNAHWRERGEMAVLEERRRLAREFHDGLAQELAFIAGRAQASDPMLAAAAQRALDESRSAIAALTRPLDAPLASLVAQAAEEVALRAGRRVVLELDPDADVPGEAREAIVRVAREAIVNAFRHADAETVRVRLTAGDSVRLVVTDDGAGFDGDAVSAGFGLTSMRERVAAIGGRFGIDTAPGTGTRVEVALP